MHKKNKNNITTIISTYNIFYLPYKETFKILPIFDSNFKICEEAINVIKNIKQAQYKLLNKREILQKTKKFIKLNLQSMNVK